jgi:hypothetical protein
VPPSLDLANFHGFLLLDLLHLFAARFGHGVGPLDRGAGSFRGAAGEAFRGGLPCGQGSEGDVTGIALCATASRA